MNQDRPVVIYVVDGAVARITLNRPEKRNALNDELIAALKDALRRSNDNEDVRAVILTGAGADFCSGADLEALKRVSEASIQETLEDARSLMELFMLLRAVRVPVIAAVRGRALAGGCGLALACDLVLASHSARFGFPEVKIGFVPAMVTAILRRNVSEKTAFELLTLGSEISAEQARAGGLVNRILADDSFDSELETFTRRFQTLSKSAVSLTKRLLYQIDGLAFTEAIESGADTNAIARQSDHCKKGVARFLRKE